METKTNTWKQIIGVWIIFSMTMALSLSAAPLKIMMLGDSITEGDAIKPNTPEANTSIYPDGSISTNHIAPKDRISYRGKLWSLLKEAGYEFGVDVDFVGGRSTGTSYDESFDTDHEGYLGHSSAKLLGLMDGILDKNVPDIALLHIGTNDGGASVDMNTTTENIKAILDAIFTKNPNTKIFVARIIEARRVDTRGHTWKTNLLNNKIAAMVGTHPKTANIKMVDMQSGAGMIYNPCGTVLGDMQPFHEEANNNYDFHPNVNGYTKIAQKWFDDMIESKWLFLDTNNNGISDDLEQDWFDYDKASQTATITPLAGGAQSVLTVEGLTAIPEVEENTVALTHTLGGGIKAYIKALETGLVNTGFRQGTVDDSTLKTGTSFKAGTKSVIKSVTGKVIIETEVTLDKDESLTIGGK